MVNGHLKNLRLRFWLLRYAIKVCVRLRKNAKPSLTLPALKDTYATPLITEYLSSTLKITSRDIFFIKTSLGFQLTKLLDGSENTLGKRSLRQRPDFFL